MDGRSLPAIGERVGTKYRIDRLLGEGGMGVVFAATHLRLEQRVALKLLRPEYVSDVDCVARFEREARAAAKLQSANSARIFDVDATEAGVPYLVMELLEGEDLASYLRTRGKLPADEAVDLVLQASSAIAEAHAQGIVHRDLKPGNLFLTSDRTVKVLDFGISKVLGEVSQNTSTAVTFGTPHYMAPEQMVGAKTVNGQADLWSLGVILYRLLSGRFPYTGDTAAAIAVMIATVPPTPFAENENVPPGLAAVVWRALARDTSARWPDARSFMAALAPFARVGHPLARESQRLLAERPVQAKRTLVMTPPPSSRAPGPILTPAVELPSGGHAVAASMPAPRTGPPPPPRRLRVSPWLAVGAVGGLLVVGAVAATAWRGRVPSAEQPAPESPAAALTSVTRATPAATHEPPPASATHPSAPPAGGDPIAASSAAPPAAVAPIATASTASTEPHIVVAPPPAPAKLAARPARSAAPSAPPPSAPPSASAAPPPEEPWRKKPKLDDNPFR